VARRGLFEGHQLYLRWRGVFPFACCFCFDSFTKTLVRSIDSQDVFLRYRPSLLLSLTSVQNLSTWSPPGPGDVRGPCPGLNSLANNDKGMTLPILIKGLKDGMNVGADFSTAIGTAGILSVPDNLLATSFDLNNLDEHNFPVEHDASLSRADYNINNGDNYSFNQSIFDTMLKYYDDMNETSIPVASAAK
jgi:hypothetical protein